MTSNVVLTSLRVKTGFLLLCNNWGNFFLIDCVVDDIDDGDVERQHILLSDVVLETSKYSPLYEHTSELICFLFSFAWLLFEVLKYIRMCMCMFEWQTARKEKEKEEKEWIWIQRLKH